MSKFLRTIKHRLLLALAAITVSGATSFAVLAPVAVVEAGCGAAAAAVTPAQWVSAIDGFLNGTCDALTSLPDEVQVCTGVKVGEGLAGTIAGYFGAPTTSAKLKSAIAAHRAARAAGAPRADQVRVHGMPVFAPQPIADALNDPAENAACIAWITVKLSQGAHAAPKDGGSK